MSGVDLEMAGLFGMIDARVSGGIEADAARLEVAAEQPGANDAPPDCDRLLYVYQLLIDATPPVEDPESRGPPQRMRGEHSCFDAELPIIVQHLLGRILMRGEIFREETS
jgi:hypothetical protein